MCDVTTNIRFVKEVKKRPLLYDITLPQYTRRDLTEAGWEEVGRAMNMTGAACKEKWKNLRTVYTRHMKKSSDEPFEKRKKYYLTDHMNFIVPFIKGKNPSNHSGNSPGSGDANSDVQLNLNDVHYSESLEDSLPDQEDDNIFPFVRIKSDPSEFEDPPSHDGMMTVTNYIDPDSGTMSEKGASHSKGNNAAEDRNTENSIKIESTASCRPVARTILEARRMFLLGLFDEVAVMTDAQMWSFKRKVLQLIDEVRES